MPVVTFNDTTVTAVGGQILTASRVDVHPLVLLSVVDHFIRVNSRTGTERRVVGLLMGSFIRHSDPNFTTTDISSSSAEENNNSNVVLDINNCFAVPFEEDSRDPDVWFLDTNYAQTMLQMEKKVLPKARIVGWYSSGPTIQHNDVLLHALVADRFCPNPVYCIVNTNINKKGVPVLAYIATEGREEQLEFRNLPTHLGASKPETIGIEQLLRDINDSTVTTLSTKIADRQLSLSQLETLLGSLEEYLRDVADGKLPISHNILAVVQELLSLQPYVHQLKSSDSMIVSQNDEAFSTFIAATSRCVMSLYNVLLNRRQVAKALEKSKTKKAQEAVAAEEKNNKK